MTKAIQNINLIHSVIFLLITCFFSLILNGYINSNINPTVCLFLILTIGISHGALDNFKGKKILGILGSKNMFKFYFSYLATSLIVIVTWLLFPTLSLIVFLIFASYHFGKEDTQFLMEKNSIKNQFLYFLKGSLVILAPMFFHFDETVTIYKFLLVEDESFYLTLDYIESNNILLIGIILSTLSSIFLFIKKFEIKKFAIFLDFFSIIILNYYFSPLVAFTIYFCFLHSIRHSISLIHEIDNFNFNNGLRIFLKKALPLTILTAILCLISVFFLNNSYDLNSSIYKVIFIGLASLTFPHILLEYLLEKNEK